MLRIFADDEQSAVALDNLALRTALANGGAYFHDRFLLAYGNTTKHLIILVIFASVQFRRRSQYSWDSQDQRVAFRDGHRMFLVGRQGSIR